jgi:aspartate carbamoyltransferase catalytic subunit
MPSLKSSPVSLPEFKGRSLLDTRADHFSAGLIYSLFEHADELEKIEEKFGNYFDPRENVSRIQRVVACLFLEPSTRTMLSFQTAVYRLGHNAVVMDCGMGSSMSKGETDVDTTLNFLAMKPDALVIRSNHSPALEKLISNLPIPVISGGTGTQSHPTQALLDAYTILKECGSIKGQRVLITGDILHSRVARSDFDVLSKLGADIAICGPENLLPPQSEIPDIKIFHDLDEALSWPSVYMGLRIQLERHDSPDLKTAALESYHARFGLNRDRLKKLSKDAIIMHPGPINHGVEFSLDVVEDPRSRILKQVSNGVLIRAALLSKILGDRDR